MNDLEASSVIVKVLADQNELAEDVIFESMAALELSGEQAVLAYHFTMIAWGRHFLDGLGIRFSSLFMIFDKAGNLVRSGQLMNERLYVSALEIAKQGHPSFAGFAVMSSEVQAVNQALSSGSSPDGLETGPAAIFLGSPDEEAMQRASAQIESAMSKEPDKRPWWKFGRS